LQALDAPQDGASVRGIYCAAPICVSVRSIQMFDLIMLAIGLGFFALSVGYAYACDQL
jgi:hypothetical protein